MNYLYCQINCKYTVFYVRVTLFMLWSLVKLIVFLSHGLLPLINWLYYCYYYYYFYLNNMNKAVTQNMCNSNSPALYKITNYRILNKT